MRIIDDTFNYIRWITANPSIRVFNKAVYMGTVVPTIVAKKQPLKPAIRQTKSVQRTQTKTAIKSNDFKGKIRQSISNKIRSKSTKRSLTDIKKSDIVCQEMPKVSN